MIQKENKKNRKMFIVTEYAALIVIGHADGSYFFFIKWFPKATKPNCQCIRSFVFLSVHEIK